MDVVVEGISMLVTQRNEVASLIERGGGSLDRLFAALRERTATAANIYAG